MSDQSPKIFISYARDGSHGENLAAEVQSRLLKAGFEVFRDVSGLKAGDVWHHKLEFELESSDAMVLVVSEKVRSSKWVHNEVSMAEELGIPVIPVVVESIRQPLWLRHLQQLNFCEQQQWGVLIEAIDVQVKHPMVDQASLPLAPDVLKKRHVGRGGRGVRVKPTWASSSGEDQYGQYADLEYKNVLQRFRLIKAGTFWMGTKNSDDNHQVTLSKDFWLADTACTQSFWQAVTGDNPSRFKGDDSCPVETVSWNDTQHFLQQLNEQAEGLTARLPTEAQWEYACRAGTETAYSFGDDIDLAQVNFDGNIGKAIPVKSLPANPWGLYEMHGNVWEWCQDEWQEKFTATPVTDPLAELKIGQKGAERVLRGGSWGYLGWHCRSAIRFKYVSDFRVSDFGMRLSLDH